MKAYIKRGDSLYIPFARGLSIPGVQKKMRVYKSLENLKKSKHTFCQLDDNVEVAEYSEVKHGRYITNDDGDSFCSICGEMWLNVTHNFCPHCGAKMDGGAK